VLGEGLAITKGPDGLHATPISSRGRFPDEKRRLCGNGPLADRLRGLPVVRGRARPVRLAQASPFKPPFYRGGFFAPICADPRFPLRVSLRFAGRGERGECQGSLSASKWLETQGKALSSDFRNWGIFPNSEPRVFPSSQTVLGCFPYVVLRSALYVPLRGEEACRARALGGKAP
jgi:hypothetical protein